MRGKRFTMKNDFPKKRIFSTTLTYLILEVVCKLIILLNINILRSEGVLLHKQRTNMKLRMNALFFGIFLLFSVLVFRLGYLQIVKGEEYVRELEHTEEIRVNTSVPRGRIYDRYGRVLIDNQHEKAITYTRMPNTKNEDIVKIAEKLADLIDMPTNRVTNRDKQDF